MHRRIALAAALALAFLAPACRPCRAQDVPDRHGEVWGTDTHPSGSPRAQVILKHRQRNTDGSAPGPWDGLCVIASCVNALHTLGYHDEADALWARAKQLPGGYSPDKLERLLREVAPHLKWVSVEGTSTAEAERLLRAGVPVAATLSTGKLYSGMPIHHMVNPVHLDANYSAWVDNNKPEVTAWGPRSLYDRRYLDGGAGWTFAFAPKQAPVGVFAAVAVGLLIGFGLTALRAEE